MEQTVEFIETKKHSSVVTFKDRFEFRKDRGAPWLQKACFWVLKKLGAYARENQISYTRHVIEPKSFMENLYKQQNELCRRFGKSGTKLLIGSDDFAKLMTSEPIEQAMSFRAEYQRCDDGVKRICGLQVEIIPWMRGMLVMP